MCVPSSKSLKTLFSRIVCCSCVFQSSHLYATHLIGKVYFSPELVYVENIINHSHHKAIKYLIVHGTEFAAETENFIGLLPTLWGCGIQELHRRLKNGRESKDPRCKQILKYGSGGEGERIDSEERKRKKKLE